MIRDEERWLDVDDRSLTPSAFRTDRDLYWFRALGGNQDNGRVVNSLYSIVRIREEDGEIVEDVKGTKRESGKTAVYWYPKSFSINLFEIQDALYPGDNAPAFLHLDGFGDTDFRCLPLVSDYAQTH
ncbi:MAG: hypothetical protein M5R36_23010 [Deltaproteobacteria bacterium]|nr:hypothetical protein [Deltaproteobacteria bacterium]